MDVEEMKSLNRVTFSRTPSEGDHSQILRKKIIDLSDEQIHYGYHRVTTLICRSADWVTSSLMKVLRIRLE